MVTAQPEAEDPRRYRLLDTLREFAIERLRDAEEEGAVRDRHLAHFLELAERAYSEHTAAGSTRPIRLLAESADELRAALSWASHSDQATHLRLAGALHPYWRAFAMQEGARRLFEALEVPAPATAHRARALLSAGTLAAHLHDVERAESLLQESLSLAQRLADPTSAAWAQLELGTAAWLRTDFEGSRRLLESSLSAMEALQSAFGEERAALSLGTTLVWLGELGRGQDLLVRSQTMAAELGDTWGRALAEEMLGWSKITAGRYGEAERHLHAALAADILGPLGAAAVEGLAQTAAAQRDQERALRLLGVSQRILTDFNTRCAPPIAARSADLEARLRAAVGPRRAAAMLGQGRELGPAEGLAFARGGRLATRHDARAPLSAREWEVARLVADGLTSREIAESLHLSSRTVESHIEHAFKKLGLSSRTKLALWVHERNTETSGPT
jgi:DNA-binding CsgD family transcriptional regulator